MEMEVYDPNKEGRPRRLLPILSALAFVAFVAGAVVAVFQLGWVRSEIPETLAFREAEPEQVEVIEDQTLEVELDEDGTAEEITVDSVDGPATAEIDDTTLVIEPELNAAGTVTVMVTVCDEQECTIRTIVAEVLSQNDPPLANSDVVELAGGEQIIRVPVLENDSDVDDATLEIVEAAVAQGAGEVSIVDDGTVLEFRTDPDSAGPWESPMWSLTATVASPKAASPSPTAMNHHNPPTTSLRPSFLNEFEWHRSATISTTPVKRTFESSKSVSPIVDRSSSATTSSSSLRAQNPEQRRSPMSWSMPKINKAPRRSPSTWPLQS